MELALFSLFAALAVIFAIIVVAHPDPVKSTMSMVVTLFCIAVLFVMLGAPFLGAIQVLLYTGAILVLFLFVIMLLNVERLAKRSGGQRQKVTALIGSAFFVGFSATFLWRSYGRAVAPSLSDDYLSIHTLAGRLFDRFLLPFEIVGVLLLVAVVAASLIARPPGDSPIERSDP